MYMKRTDAVIAVFIDGENINQGHFQVIDQEIRKHGRIIIYNIYADWTELALKKWNHVARQNGLLCVHCDKISGKNSVDLRLSVDIMKTLYTNDTIDIYYLVTSDSDYRHVIMEIKQKNKTAHCIGVSTVSPSLTSVCDKYTTIESLLPKESKLVQVDDIWEVVHGSILEEKTNISMLKDDILRKYPTFDQKSYGYTKFSDFLLGVFENVLSIENGNCILL